MAERKCPKCDGVVSRLVRVCPHCGAKIASGTGTEIGLVLGLLVLAAAVVLVIKGAGTAPPRPTGTTQMVPPVQKPTLPPSPPPAAPPAPAPVVETPPPAPEPVEKPPLTKGMTMATVRRLWGDPVRTSSAQSATTRSDWWTYDDGQKLHFVDSVLESWAQSESPVTAAPPEATSPPGEPTPAPLPDEQSVRAYGALEAALKQAQVEDIALGHPKGLKGKLEQRYAAEVRARFGITEARQQQILATGDANRWPLLLIVFGPESGGARPSVGTVYLTGILFDLLPGREAPDEGGQKTELPPGIMVRVLGSVVVGGTPWYYVQVAGPASPNARVGWISGLTVMTAPVTHNGVIEPESTR